jgi:hypothetical protein
VRSSLSYTNDSLSVEQRRTAVVEVSRHAAAGALAVGHDVRPPAQIEQLWNLPATRPGSRVGP